MDIPIYIYPYGYPYGYPTITPCILYIYSIYPYGYPSPSGFFTPSSSVLRCHTCAKGTGKHQAAKADTAKSLRRRGMITPWSWR